MSYPIDLIIGHVTLSPTQRLPSSAFTANLRKVINGQRAQSGRFHTNTLYKKYEVSISGVAQTLIPDLRYEYERDDLIDLYMIVNRIERLNSTGTTSNFYVSRRMRLDSGEVTPIVEFPIGTQLASTSISALTNTSSEVGQISLTFNPTTGTNTILVKYYPILTGTIISMSANFDWTTGDETWGLVFMEE